MPTFDYRNQAWIDHTGRYVRCGHPAQMNCGCYGRTHEGEQADPTFLHDARVAEQHEEILAGLAREVPHSRIRQANGMPCQWTYTANGMVEVR